MWDLDIEVGLFVAREKGGEQACAFWVSEVK